MHKIVVIGGGASGMMASLSASQNGNKVILLERNEKLGKKIYITGKGRCNLTNYCDVNDFMKNVVRNNKFLYSSINSLSSYDTFSLFSELGLNLKIERGNRVFPESDKASDVTKTLEKALIKNNVDIRLNQKAEKINVVDGKVKSVSTVNDEIECDSIIICTGGISYSSTGSTGDGYAFAKKTGHKIIDLVPSLVGLELIGGDFAELQGLALKNVSVQFKNQQKIIYSDFGELLFTHFGVSGPIILSSTAIINRLDLSSLSLNIDLKPALDENTLDQRLIREFTENNSKSVSNVMPSLLPKSMVNIVLSRAQIRKDKKCCEVTKTERQNLISVLKCFTFKIKKLRPIEEAIVTSGGISVDQINPKTMESKLVKGLFFAGEVLDVDAYTGGFNLQIAFSTGFLAGNNA